MSTVPTGYIPPSAPDAGRPPPTSFAEAFGLGVLLIVLIAAFGTIAMTGFIVWLWSVAISTGGIVFGSVLLGVIAATRNIPLAIASACMSWLVVFTMVLVAPFAFVAGIWQDVGTIKENPTYFAHVRANATSGGVLVTNSHPTDRAYIGVVMCSGRSRASWSTSASSWDDVTFYDHPAKYLGPGESYMVRLDQSRQTVLLRTCHAGRSQGQVEQHFGRFR